MIRVKGSRPCEWITLGMMFVLGTFSLTSCVVAGRGYPEHEAMMDGVAPGTDVCVNEEPPPPRDEIVVGVAPGPSYVWVSGYWAWRSSDWYWVRGRWAARPSPRASWEAGRWEQRGRGFIWINGYWR